MNGYLILFLLFVVVIIVLIKRIKASSYKANEYSFTQAGVTVFFKEERIELKGRRFNIDDITNIRTEPTPNRQSLGFDCIISLKDFKLPEHRIRFIGPKQANEFMQRLAIAVEKAGGPAFR